MNTGKRTKNTNPWRGCQTCKPRDIRCDEGRPVCSNCTRDGLVCEYMPLSDRKGPQFPQANHGLPDTHLFSTPQGRTSPSMSHSSASDTTLTKASTPLSLDTYSQSLLPLTPANKALLAYCKRFNMPLLIHSDPAGGIQAD